MQKLYLIQGRGQSEVFVTDLMTKTLVPNAKMRDTWAFVIAAGGHGDGKVVPVDPEWVGSIPPNPNSGDWLRLIGGIIDGTSAKVLAGLPAGTGPSLAELASQVADELAARLKA